VGSIPTPATKASTFRRESLKVKSD
jgi:hypothetical protein